MNLKNIIKNIKNYVERNIKIIFIFSVILMLLLLQHSVIGMYFDDYGNASLSYSYVVSGVEGTNYSLSQLLLWAKEIYMGWGGRILYAITLIIPLLKTGIKPFMFIQSFVILSIIYFSYKIIINNTDLKNKKINHYIPIILFILYCCINMAYLRHGIYWASASVLYVWPLLPLIMFFYFYPLLCEKIKNNKKINYLIMYPLLFINIIFITLSQEQIGVALIAFVIIYILFNHLKTIKKYLKLDLFVIITSIFSYLFLFCAPGNWERMNTNIEFAKLSLFEKIIQNFPRIIHDIFLDKMKIYIYIIALIFFLITIKLIKENYKKNKIYNFLIPIIILNFVTMYIMYKSIYNITSIIIMSLWLIALFIITLIYAVKEKRLEFCALEIAAISSIFCLLVSPTTGGRTCLPFIFIIFIIIVKYIIDIIIQKNKLPKIIIGITLFILIFIGTKNYLINYIGYRDNYPIYKLNDKILKNYNNKDNTIILYKLENSWFGSTQSYEEPSMDYWIKQYYNIDDSVNFEWVDIYEDFR